MAGAPGKIDRIVGNANKEVRQIEIISVPLRMGALLAPNGTDRLVYELGQEEIQTNRHTVPPGRILQW
jgi:UDP-N-acetylglucosamine enolpyruvyl transferase